MASKIIDDIKFKIRNGNPITRLIIINIAVFLFISIIRIISFLSAESSAIVSFESFLTRNLSIPLSFTGFLHKPWTIITYMFTHISPMHILWNMVTLFWFGEILSQYTSAKKIIPLYLLGGIVGALVSILLITVTPQLNMYIGAPMIGASAGVTAIIVAAATLVPEVNLNLMFVGPVKLIYVALFVIFIDILNVASYDNIGGNLAHLGGALMGYIFIVQYKKGRDMATPFNRFFDWIGKLFQPKAKMKVVHKRATTDEEYNASRKANQQTIDMILDKISKSGYESLSKAEKEMLFKASGKK